MCNMNCHHCYFKQINPNDDGGHCYMFQIEPDGCLQWRLPAIQI